MTIKFVRLRVSYPGLFPAGDFQMFLWASGDGQETGCCLHVILTMGPGLLQSGTSVRPPVQGDVSRCAA